MYNGEPAHPSIVNYHMCAHLRPKSDVKKNILIAPILGNVILMGRRSTQFCGENDAFAHEMHMRRNGFEPLGRCQGDLHKITHREYSKIKKKYRK